MIKVALKTVATLSFKKLPHVKTRPSGENSPNLATRPLTPKNAF
jgi:hypothetical protein